MTRTLGVLRCFVVLSALLATVAIAVPNVISYQGLLRDGNGVQLSGTFSVTFRIYDVDTGGTALWTENQNVLVTNGIFNVQLGAAVSMPSSVFSQDVLYLSVQVGADQEMAPRQRLTSAAFSHRAELLSSPIVPIGGIVAWNKSMTGTPALPSGWVECNGQVLSDSASTYNGLAMPNLNGTTGTSRFLRGSTVSGVTGGSDTHSHTLSNNQYAGNGAYRYNMGTVSTESNLPSYFSVVWIMRVK